MSIMLRLLRLLPLLAFVAIGHSQAAATSVIEIEVDDGLIDLRAEKAPLGDVLIAIGEAASIKIVLNGAFATLVNEWMSDEPLEEAVRSLTNGHSLVIKRSGTSSNDNRPAVTEIRITESDDAAVSATTADDKVRLATGASGGEAIEGSDNSRMDRVSFRVLHEGASKPNRGEILDELDAPDRTTRAAAIAKVGSLTPSAALQTLRRAFEAEDDPVVRSRVIAALSRVDHAQAGRLFKAWATTDEEPSVRSQAIRAFARFAGERSVNLISRIRKSDPELEVRLVAIKTLRRIDGDFAVHALRSSLNDPHEDVRLAAAIALAELEAQN